MLSTQQITDINKRMEQGEKLATILRSMGIPYKSEYARLRHNGFRIVQQIAPIHPTLPARATQ